MVPQTLIEPEVSNLPALSMNRALKLILTGLSMGVLHVLAGPDHLSALATLASGNSFRAVYLGVRWGLGHSMGLIVVAVIFIALKGELDLRKIGRYCDVLVGLFMVVLGILSVFSSLRQYKEKRSKKISEELDLEIERNNSFNPGIAVSIISNKPTTSLLARSISNSHIFVDHRKIHVRLDESSERDDASDSLDDISLLQDDDRLVTKINNSPWSWHIHFDSIDMNEPITQRIVSFLIGLLHGIAGPGGILGVLPAVEMRCWYSAFIYLGSFVIASTFSMGAFAAMYGEVTKRLSATADCVELGLGIFSASMSILVGLVWLVFSMLGKLDHFFH